MMRRWTSPAGTAYQVGLYTVGGLPSDKAHWIEDGFLLSADTQASIALQHMLHDRLDAVQGDLKTAWSRFIISVWNRNPERIAWLKGEWETMSAGILPGLRERYERDRGENDPATFEEFESGPGKDITARGLVRGMQSLMDLENVGQRLNDMSFAVFTFDRVPEPLLTSDRPIVKTFPLDHLDANLTIPLSPSKLFVAANSDAVFRRIESDGARLTIARVNNMIVRQAAKFVYGPNDGMFQFIERRLNRDPDALRWATFHR
jgi:Protein of unknown function (DUF4238)